MRGLVPTKHDHVNESIYNTIENKQQEIKQNHDMYAANKNSNIKEIPVGSFINDAT